MESTQPAVTLFGRSLATTGAALLMCACASASCATKPAPRPAVKPELPQEVVRARLADAEATASRGCYVCLLEASAIYESLVQASSSVEAARKALETDLMLVLRERELVIPDSGAQARADVLRPRFGVEYDPHFALLVPQQTRDSTLAALAALEPRWPAEPVSAYFYLAFALQAGRWDRGDLGTEPQKIAAAHPRDASVQYRISAFQPTYNAAAASALLDAEPRFGEIRLIRGQRSLMGGGIVTARKELAAAYDVLPQSLTIKSVFGAIEFAYARYPEALKLFDEVLAAGPNPVVRLTRAEVLSYLERHREAIDELDHLLADDPRTNPGDKYYWRAWNKLQLAELRPAYDDATTALKFMNGPDPYRLAGITTFALEALTEARGYFESALKMLPFDCDSMQYIGQLDAAERKWADAAANFAKAAACFKTVIAGMTSDLAAKEAANVDGLLDGQIARLRIDIAARQKLLEQSVTNAAIAAKNSPPVRPPAR